MFSRIIITVLPIMYILMILAWFVTEFILLKEVRKNNGKDAIWLAINIILPNIGFIIYKLSQKSVDNK